MRHQRFIFIIKLVLFLFITYSSFSLIYYFPDLPPALRLVLKKGAIKISTDKVDKRFLKWMDRDPQRRIPDGPSLIVSPADGIVQYVDILEGKQHVVIEMRYTDVHVQRVPIDGEVIEIQGGGEKLPQGTSPYKYASEKMLPYQKRTIFKTEIGEIAVRQITSFFASRAEVFVETGEHVKRGQRLGRVIAGSTIVLELPMNINILTSKNQNILAGETIIAKY